LVTGPLMIGLLIHDVALSLTGRGSGGPPKGKV
jgi:hypothetical protein